MIISQIISGLMVLVSIGLLLVTIFTNKITRPVRFKKFFVATTIVFVTGTILVAVIINVRPEIPLIFTIISEIMISAIYSFSMFMIRKLGMSLSDLQDAKIKAEEAADTDSDESKDD